MDIVADGRPVVNVNAAAVQRLLYEAREAGDRAFIHHSACPTRKRGEDCLRCIQIDAAANVAEDRLSAAMRAR